MNKEQQTYTNSDKKGLIPELRFPEFNKYGGWVEKTIDNIKSIVTDYVANGSFASLKENVEVVTSKDYGYYIRLTDLRAGIGHKEQKYVTKKSYDFLNKSALSGGEILMANIGANVGEIWQMPKVDKPATLAPNMIMAKFVGNAINKFVYYFLKSELGKKNVAITISGNAHPKINKTEFKQVKIVLPDSEKEQQKIANCLSSLDNLINAETEKLDLLQDHKKGLLQQLFPQQGESQPKYRFPEFKDDGDWEENELGKICDVRDGTHDSPKYVSDGYPLITSKNLLENGAMDFENVTYLTQVDYDKINKRSKVDVGDILFGMIGTIGNPVLVKRDVFAIKNVALIKTKGLLEQEYLIQLLKSNYIDIQFKKANAGGILKFIALGMIRKLIIPTPKKEEQQKIANCLSSVDDLIESQQQKIEGLKAHKKGLLQKLFPTIKN